MILTTERLILRQLELSDKKIIYFLRSDNEHNKYIDRPSPSGINEAEAFIQKIRKSVDAGESYYWAIAKKEYPPLIGTVCLWNLSPDKKTGEIGYELLPTMQGQGYMKEAVQAVIECAFHTIGITKLEAYTHRDNKASTTLLLKFGFRLDNNRSDPANEDNIIFTLSSTDS